MVDRREHYTRREGDRTKPIFMSRTVLSAFVGMAASAVGLFGYDTLSCEEQKQLVGILLPFITLISSFGCFLFRLLVTQRIE